MGTRYSTPRRYRKKRNYEIPESINDPVSTVSRKVDDTEEIIEYHNDEFVDVIGSDSGNLTVFSWITQLSTCCSSLCTLVVLVAFVIWMFMNRNINSVP